MTTTPQPLWDDARIDDSIEWDVTDNGQYVSWRQAHRILHEMRDQYEHELAVARARIGELEAAPTDDIRELMAFYRDELSHRPRTGPLVARVREWLDSLEPQP